MEPLRNLYTDEKLEAVAEAFRKLEPAFPAERFMDLVRRDPWGEAPFKERMRLVTLALRDTLPESYERALHLLCQAAKEFRGVEYIFFPDFIELRGMEKPEHEPASLAALAEISRYSTSEFAIRPFLLRRPEAVMERLALWSKSPDEHVRRLASEGCRPRLPWGTRLPVFVRDPEPVLSLLETMLDDASEYVRRSVANNLNDIAKDHPQRVLELAVREIGRSARTDWILKHGCRTLLKQGLPEALALFGYPAAADAGVEQFRILTPSVEFGGELEFSFEVHNRGDDSVPLRIEYEIGFVKASGSLSGKRFKLSERSYPPGISAVARHHALKPITTRRYYPGVHALKVLVNGVELAAGSFELTMPAAEARL